MPGLDSGIHDEVQRRKNFSIGIFKAEMKKNLQCIRVMRNAFAHSVVPISFKTNEVINVCDLMVMPVVFGPVAFNAKTGEPLYQIKPNDTPRKRFQKICEAVAHNLAIYGATSSKPPRSYPTKKGFGIWEKPEPLP